jgi:hypothetical protein
MEDYLLEESIDSNANGLGQPGKEKHLNRSDGGKYVKNVPIRFRTTWARLACLISVFIGSCLASGPVTSWPTFEPLLGKYGVLGSTQNKTSPALSEVYALGQGMMLVLGLPMGAIYDAAGPDKTAAIGGLTSALGLSLMAFCITRPSYHWWLYWAYPLTVGGGGLCSYCVLGFMWLIPKYQTMIGSLLGASYAVSDSLALVGVYLIANTSTTLPLFFYGLAALGGLSGVLCWAVSPSLKQNQHFYQVANFGSDADTGDAKGSTAREIFLKMIDLIKDSRVVFLFRPTIMKLMQIVLILFYLAQMYPTLVMYNYFVVILGANDATRLVDIFPVIYGTFGAVFSLSSGWVCDRIGLVRFVQWMVPVQIVVSVSVLLPYYSSQIVWLISSAVMGQSLIIMYMRFAARYAPFQLFGTFMGLMATLMALPQMFFGTSLQNLMKRIYSEANDPRRFTVMFGILNGLTTLSMFSLVYHWYYFPPPAAGSVLMEKSEDGKPTLKIVKLASEKRNSTL